MRYLFPLLLLCLTAGQGYGQDSYQSPLDRWYEEESITNRDNPNNRYYTGNEVVEYDYDEQQGNNDCRACLTPNPPWFCFEPGHPCDGASVPIDSGIVLLLLGGGLLGAYGIRKQQLSI